MLCQLSDSRQDELVFQDPLHITFSQWVAWDTICSWVLTHLHKASPVVLWFMWFVVQSDVQSSITLTLLSGYVCDQKYACGKKQLFLDNQIS